MDAHVNRMCAIWGTPSSDLYPFDDVRCAKSTKWAPNKFSGVWVTGMTLHHRKSIAALRKNPAVLVGTLTRKRGMSAIHAGACVPGIPDFRAFTCASIGDDAAIYRYIYDDEQRGAGHRRRALVLA